MMNMNNSAVQKLYESVVWREALDASLFAWRDAPEIRTGGNRSNFSAQCRLSQVATLDSSQSQQYFRRS